MKLLLWLGKLAIAAVFVSAISIFASWTAVHTYLDKLLAKYQLGNGTEQIEFSDFLTKLSSQLNIITMKPNEKKPPEKDDGGKVPADAPKSGDAVPVWNQSGKSASSAAEQKRKVMMTAEDLQTLKEKMTSEDKMKVFALLSSRLPQNEIQTISQLVENGITEEKLGQIQTIMEKYLKPNEYQQLLDILSKY